MKIKDYLKEHILLTDGAMGTYFDEKTEGQFLCSEEANLFQPDIIREIHQSYIEAGAVLIRSNTFSANRKTYEDIMKKHGMPADDAGFVRFVQAGYAIAKEAAAEAAKQGRTVFAAADIGPVYEDSESSEAEMQKEYREIIDAFLEAGADLFVLETFPDTRYVLFMAEYIRQRWPDAFIIGQFSFVPTGYGRTGFHYKTVLKKAVGSGLLDGAGLNCGIGAAHMERFLRSWLEESGMPKQVVLTALPNCGYPQIVRGHAVYSDSVSYFGEKAENLAKLGVGILGGCCGTTPEYIREIAVRLQGSGRKKYPRIRLTTGKQTRQTVTEGNEIMNRRGGKEASGAGVSAGQKAEEAKTAGNSRDAGERLRHNTFCQKLAKGEPVIAVELDPPFDAQMEKLMNGAHALADTPADIITIADSPLARSRADALLTAVKIQQETGIPVMPHLACRDRNRIAIRSGILGAYVNDVRNMLIVTGDPVGREEREFTKSVFDFNSIKLMEFLQSLNEELFADAPLCYGGALNQNGARADKIAERMKRKMDAGCQFFLTQPVYSEEEIDRLAFLQRETGAKILIGIMPLVSYRNALFIKNEMPGIHVPDEVLARYSPEGSREEWEQTALTISGQVISMGKDVGAGYYFMTPFHRVSLIQRIMENCLPGSGGAAGVRAAEESEMCGQ